MKLSRLVTVALCIAAILFSLGGGAYAMPVSGEALGVVLYVKESVSGDCTSWTDACDLQHALDIANEKDQIWVMEGTYVPSEVGDRSASFRLPFGVSLYGGFDGTETARNQRFWATQPSILSGDLLDNDDPDFPETYDDNSFQVVTGTELDNQSILDGFTITGGFGNVEPFDRGSGLSLVNSNPILRHLIIHANQAIQGGGMMLNNSDPFMFNVIIAGNSATKTGGGIYMLDSDPQLVNVTLANNSADTEGGAIALQNSTPTLVNAIIWNNKPDQLSSDAANITFSIVQDGYPGTGNLDTDPLFVDLDNYDFHLQTTSPAIEAGDTHAVPEEISTDLDGNRRFVDFDNNGTELVDMGAYEAHHIIFVDQQAVGLDNGSCWDNAFVDLQDALGVAAAGNEIWVAEGTYLPSATNVREASFSMKNNVGIFGGFAGVETAHGQRDWVQNPTILSGDLGVVGNISDNSYHVVYNSSITSTARLDGFTITAGNADGTYPYYIGGGMYNAVSSPTLTNITFSDNSAEYSGGGMYNNYSNPILVNMTFYNNTSNDSGGGIASRYSSPSLTNITFSSNSAQFGGGMSNIFDSYPTLTNVTFFANSAANSGGAIDNYFNSHPTLINCILWGNAPDQINNYAGNTPVVTYSLVQGGYSGEGNISGDPILGPLADNGGFTKTHSLGWGSPAIDWGSPTVCPLTDQRGVTRPLDGNGDSTARCDMGAYEYDPGPWFFSFLPLIVR